MKKFFEECIGFSVAVLLIVLILLVIGGCMSTARVERGAGPEACRAVVQGSMFSFWTPAVIGECRPEVK